MACVTSKPPRTTKECRAIIDRVDAINPVVAAMLEFSALTGLRYSDVSKLRIADLYINGVIRSSIEVVQSKSYNKRLTSGASKDAARVGATLTIYINDQCKSVVADAATNLNRGKTLLFESSFRVGKPYTAQYVNKLLKVVAFELKLDYPLSTHSFRKSFAKNICDNGAKIYQVRDALGQASLSSTDAYLATFMGDAKELTEKISF